MKIDLSVFKVILLEVNHSLRAVIILLPVEIRSSMFLLWKNTLVHSYGSNDNLRDQRSEVAYSISQLIMYMVKGTHISEDSVSKYHKRYKETPFPLYIGLKLHSDTCHSYLIEMFHDLRICVSYKRV